MSNAVGSVPFPPRPGQVMAWDGTKYAPATGIAAQTGTAAVPTDAATTGGTDYGFTEAQANAIVAVLNRLLADNIAAGISKAAP